MPHSPSNTGHGLPPWLVFLGTLLIAGHFTAIAATVLAAPSGPWPMGDGVDVARPPVFAEALNRLVATSYLKWIKMAQNYHFPSNRPVAPGVSFEVRLKDDAGQPLATLHFPDKDANYAVRHRQAVLARQLAPDQPLPPQQGEAIAAPNRQVRTVQYWELGGAPRTLKLKSVPEHLVPRNGTFFRPEDWSLVLARSYARHLCRAHGAARAEIVRHTRDALPPPLIVQGQLPPDAFADLVANFGEYSRD